MNVTNATAHPHGTVILQDRLGRHQQVVVVKQTFRLSTACPDPRLTSVPVCAADELRPSGAVGFPADYAPTRQGTSVICSGTVHAPAGEPASRGQARVRVGPVERRFVVHGERQWIREGEGFAPSEPEPFVTMPFDFEHAFGGRDGERFDDRKPVGRGFWDSAAREDPEGLPLPCIESEDGQVQRPDDHPEPACASAVAPSWQPRLGHAGTYDEPWQQTRAPLLPRDFDDRFFDVAATGLVAEGFLRGGEPIELEGLSAQGVVVSAVPYVLVRIRVARRWVKPHLDILLLEPDEDRMTLTLRTSIDVTGRMDWLPEILVSERQLVRLGAA